MATVSAVAESNDDGVILFAFTFPGACGWGPTEAAARERLRWSIRECRDWLVRHDLEPLAPRIDPDDDEIEIDERVPATGDPLDCDSEGFFDYDQAAYADDEVARIRTLLERSRADLLDLVTDQPPAVLDHRLVEDRRTIRDVVDHVAITEHWYLTRVELPVNVPADWRAYPEQTFERLSATRADVERVLDALPSLPSAQRAQTWTLDGERWSQRKMLRRLVWHERLHLSQLDRLVSKVEAAVG